MSMEEVPRMGRKKASSFHNLPKLLSIPEVCAYLSLGQTVVREMIRKDEIPHIRIRSRIRVSEDDIREYLRSRTVGCTCREREKAAGWPAVMYEGSLCWLKQTNHKLPTPL